MYEEYKWEDLNHLLKLRNKISAKMKFADLKLDFLNFWD